MECQFGEIHLQVQGRHQLHRVWKPAIWTTGKATRAVNARNPTEMAKTSEPPICSESVARGPAEQICQIFSEDFWTDKKRLWGGSFRPCGVHLFESCRYRSCRKTLGLGDSGVWGQRATFWFKMNRYLPNLQTDRGVRYQLIICGKFMSIALGNYCNRIIIAMSHFQFNGSTAGQKVGCFSRKSLVGWRFVSTCWEPKFDTPKCWKIFSRCSLSTWYHKKNIVKHHLIIMLLSKNICWLSLVHISYLNHPIFQWDFAGKADNHIFLNLASYKITNHQFSVWRTKGVLRTGRRRARVRVPIWGWCKEVQIGSL